MMGRGYTQQRLQSEIRRKQRGQTLQRFPGSRKVTVSHDRADSSVREVMMMTVMMMMMEKL